MARIRFVRHVLPVGIVLGLAGGLYLIPAGRAAVENIDSSVADICAQAGAHQKPACVDALIAELESDPPISFKRKNQIVWALGQLADPRALPTLEAMVTGEQCPRPCDATTHVCQYELDKAIRWCRGEAWLMRGLRRVYGSRW